MPSFSKSWSGLTPNANICFLYRPTSSNTAIPSNTTTSSNGTYSASFNYEYNTNYTWSLYYGHYGSLTTKIDGGTVYEESPPLKVTNLYFEFSSIRLKADGETYGCNYSIFLSKAINDSSSITVTTNNSNSSAVEIVSHTKSLYTSTTIHGTITVKPLSSGINSSSILTINSGGKSASITINIDPPDNIDPPESTISDFGFDYNSIYCTFSNIKVGDKLLVTAGSKSSDEITATSTSKTVWVTGLSSNTSYKVTASVNGIPIWSRTITTDIYVPSPTVSGVTISGDDIRTLTIGESETINYSISISNDNGTITPSVKVKSSDAAIVNCSDLTKSRKSGSFKINALSEGTAIITVEVNNSKTDTITVNSISKAKAYIGD